MSGKKTTGKAEADEAWELIRAAEDEMLLKLSLNSHMLRASDANSYIDPDLDRRFQALKSSSKLNPQPPAPTPTTATTVPRSTDGEAIDDNLFARFAALRNSLPSSSDHSDRDRDLREIKSVGSRQGNDDVEEDQVQKVIQWAMDAARLDPSPPTDSDDDCDGDDVHSNDGDGASGKKKGRR